MKNRIRSFGYAIKGIKAVFGKEANMNIHLIMTALVIICGFVFMISITEWMLCILCFGVVISLEMVNSAIENLVDLVSPEKHELAGKIKDISAGAVLIASICAAIVGLIIIVPKGWVVVQWLAGF
ncbi:MAG: diacylglycerol kinase family protein [Paludibacter sp.]